MFENSQTITVYVLPNNNFYAIIEKTCQPTVSEGSAAETILAGVAGKNRFKNILSIRGGEKPCHVP